MTLTPELQRLLVHNDLELSNTCVVDCSAVERWRAEAAPQGDPWPIFFEAASRSKRDLSWHIGPTAIEHFSTRPEKLDDLERRLVKQFGQVAVIRTVQPLTAVLLAQPQARTVALITAGVETRPYHLYPL